MFGFVFKVIYRRHPAEKSAGAWAFHPIVVARRMKERGSIVAYRARNVCLLLSLSFVVILGGLRRARCVVLIMRVCTFSLCTCRPHYRSMFFCTTFRKGKQRERTFSLCTCRTLYRSMFFCTTFRKGKQRERTFPLCTCRPHYRSMFFRRTFRKGKQRDSRVFHKSRSFLLRKQFHRLGIYRHFHKGWDRHSMLNQHHAVLICIRPMWNTCQPGRVWEQDHRNHNRYPLAGSLECTSHLCNCTSD